MSVYPGDVTPAAIRGVGGGVTSYRVSVLPGSMLVLSCLGDIPITGLLVYSICHGGLGIKCSDCPFPNCSFRKEQLNHNHKFNRNHNDSPTLSMIATRCQLVPTLEYSNRGEVVMSYKRRLFNINGVDRWLVVSPEITLAEVLRNNLMLTGCKVCCSEGHCGTCTVIVDGKPNKACITKMEKVPDRASILTIEGIGMPGHLHPL
jgi:ferredoxin